MTEKVGGIELTASIDTTGAVQAGKVLAKTADQMAADLAKVAAAAEEAAKAEQELAAKTEHLSRVMQQSAKNAEQARAAHQANTTKILEQRAAQEAARQPVEQMIAALRDQAATLGLNARQLILYKAAQAGASVEDKKAIIQSLNQIESYRRKEEATRKATAALRESAVAQGVAQGSMKSLRGAAGNLGFQLQDIAVQAQMGTSAFVILGQQGSQVASAFGPGGAVVGAVIAVAAAIGGVLFTSLNKTSAEIKEQFLPNIEELKENLDQISKAQASVAILQIREELDPLSGIARSAAAQVEYLTKQIEKYPNNNDIKEWNKELVTQQGILDGVNQKIIKLNEDQTAFQAVIKRNIEGTQGQQEADKKRIETIADLVAATEMQAKTAGLTQRGIALYVAEQAKASVADIKRINAAYDLIEAEDKLKDASKAGIKEDDAKTKALKSVFNGLNEQYQKLTMNTDAYEEYAAVQQAEAAGATPAQIAAIRAKVKALQEERAAIQSNIDLQDEVAQNEKDEAEQKKQVTTEFRSVQAGIQADLETPAQAAERELKERLEVIRQYNGLFTQEEAKRTTDGIAAETAYQKRLTEIKKQEDENRKNQNMDMARSAADTFGILADIAKEGGKKSFDQWKIFASAQAAISAALAITNALTLPPPFGFIAAGAIGAATAIQIAKINSTQYSGGRLYGGAVQAGGMYRVTENGKPEVFEQGGQQYLLPGSKGGSVVSNKDMQASGGGGGITINYNPTIYAQDADFESIMAGQPEAVLNAVRAGLASEGRTL